MDKKKFEAATKIREQIEEKGKALKFWSEQLTQTQELHLASSKDSDGIKRSSCYQQTCPKDAMPNEEEFDTLRDLILQRVQSEIDDLEKQFSAI